jgi:hypothetical protein
MVGGGGVKDLFGRPVVTAAELDEMTPAQRREVIRSRIVWDLSELPEEYVARLRAAAEQHLAEREGGEAGEAPGARAS